jgi:hypothetical protein
LNFNEPSSDRKIRKNKENNDSKQSSTRDEKSSREIMNDSFKLNTSVLDKTGSVMVKNAVSNENLVTVKPERQDPNFAVLAKDTQDEEKFQISEPKQNDKESVSLQPKNVLESNTNNEIKQKPKPNYLVSQNQEKLEEENKQKKEKTKEALDALEELERKKRWTDKTYTDDESVEQKKEDLLAKLFSNTETTTSVTLKTTPSTNISFKDTTNHSKPPKVQNNFNTSSKLLQDRMFSPEIIEGKTVSYSNGDLSV